eukprot:6966659-Pyramimonas_sp.AAC.1
MGASSDAASIGGFKSGSAADGVPSPAGARRGPAPRTCSAECAAAGTLAGRAAAALSRDHLHEVAAE